MGTYTESRNQTAESLDECIHRAMSRVSVDPEQEVLYELADEVPFLLT